MAFTRKNLIYATGLFWLTAQLYCAFQPVDAMLMRAILLSCSLAIAFLAKPFSGTSNRYINIIIDTSGYFISIGVLLYIALNTTRLSSRIPYVDEIFSLDIALCILYVILIFETGRRYLGWSMNVVCLIFLVYGFFGANLPSIFTHSGIDLHVFTEVQFLTTGGIFSSPIATTVSTVYYFMIFGGFLAATPAGTLFASCAKYLTRNSLGGAGKATVISAGLFGMISGSGPGNTATVGALMLPMMNEAKFSPKFSAALFAVGGTGGLLIPPVMGATAFVMADMIGTPYLTIAKCASLPALLYVISLLWIVHLEADKHNIKNPHVDKAELVASIKKYCYLVLPIFSVIYFIASGKSLMFAALASTLLIIILCQIRKESRLSIKQIIDMGVEATTSCVGLALPCALAGIVIGVIVYTGLGLRFSALIAAASAGSLIFALLLAMLMIIIMGMGMPTTAAYIMSAILLGPALENLNIQPLVGHMFMFYFAIISLITPPVAIASYTAAGICKTGLWETGLEGMRLALTLFLIPFVFVYNPGLLGIGDYGNIIQTFSTTLLGIVGVGMVVTGYYKGNLSIAERMLCCICAMLLIVPETYTDIIGTIGILAIIILRARRYRGKIVKA
ncbi:TRAP transporter permease [Cloacibacillus evryensis]|uniref:TRAP transporter permease n=1 Tax=Cloacibacillus evryensis TaxID=508460 RepID=UPI0004BCABF3|nr:TRAP transporter fused permease subunit [Cloacibacillus evryensis]MEA5036413.1 TRAP transporter fused permease subunit [Cloacibacillus evryensis]